MSGIEIVKAHEVAAVMADLGANDGLKWRPVATVEKYDDDQVAFAERTLGRGGLSGVELASVVDAAEVVIAPGNLLTTAGLGRIWDLILGDGGQAATNLATRLGVGNSSTAAAIGQTDLQAAAGSANRYFMTMDATFPSNVSGVATFKASYATGDGNFVWNEWCVDIGTPTVTAGTTVNAIMLNRAVQSLGTKASGTWVLTATITLS
jgi:hypothetical protein